MARSHRYTAPATMARKAKRPPKIAVAEGMIYVVCLLWETRYRWYGSPMIVECCSKKMDWMSWKNDGGSLSRQDVSRKSYTLTDIRR